MWKDQRWCPGHGSRWPPGSSSCMNTVLWVIFPNDNYCKRIRISETTTRMGISWNCLVSKVSVNQQNMNMWPKKKKSTGRGNICMVLPLNCSKQVFNKVLETNSGCSRCTRHVYPTHYEDYINRLSRGITQVIVTTFSAVTFEWHHLQKVTEDVPDVLLFLV